MKWDNIIGTTLLSFALICLVVLFWPTQNLSTLISFSIPDDLSGTLELIQSNRVLLGEKTEISLKVTIIGDQQGRQVLKLFNELELDNLEVTPKGEGIVIVVPSKPLVFKWTTIPLKAGTTSGTLWLFSESVYGDKDLILARPIRIETKTFLGFSSLSAKIFSLVILVIGVLIFFYSRILRILAI
ncbi:MAG: hypothetical protein CVU42_09525 [Chloroflexi bacterium HGW-Chloroflexi-4]|jgi:hypothetical protein|nr:MAG: hypothetical protein CVU42_09525 [Chloroflexi bacterium HGW-Chloroflexi-4]